MKLKIESYLESIARERNTDLIGELGLYFLLETAQQEWSQNLVKTSNDQQCLFLVKFNLTGEVVKG